MAAILETGVAVPLIGILARYSGPTDCRGARVLASVYGMRGKGTTCFQPWTYDRSAKDEHLSAAIALARKIGGFGKNETVEPIGSMSNKEGDGWLWIFLGFELAGLE